MTAHAYSAYVGRTVGVARMIDGKRHIVPAVILPPVPGQDHNVVHCQLSDGSMVATRYMDTYRADFCTVS